MEPLSQDTINKLRDLEKYILDVPARFNLAFWGVHIDESKRDEDVENLLWGCDLAGYGLGEKELEQALEANPPCGTVACLAGNVCIMAGKVDAVKVGDTLVYKFGFGTKLMAQEYLGLTNEQGGRLFYPYNYEEEYSWPQEWQDKLEDAKPGTKEYAQVAVDRIEHFIATNGEE